MNGFTRLAVPLAAALLLLTASPASATDYCVAPNTSCGGTDVATLEAALDLADNAPDSDRIFLGAATYTAPTANGFSYTAMGAPLEIVGAGRGQTIMTSPIGGSNQVLVLLAGPDSSIRDLTLRLPQNAAEGLSGLATNAAVRRIDVVEAVTQANLRIGVQLYGGASLDDSTVTLGDAQATLAVQFFSGVGAVRDSTVQARKAVAATGDEASIARSMLRGTTGIDASRGATSVTDTLIEAATGIYAGAPFGESITVNLDGVTLNGTDDGVFVTNTGSGTATVNLVDAVLRGYARPLGRFGEGAGQANLNASYSDYDPGGNEADGPGNLMQSNVTNSGDARFVDPGAGDYRLRFDSPLIDAGEPGAPTTMTDLAGGARLVDGDAGGGARRDIGAYEYQAQAPVAAVTGPAAASAGQQVSFSGAGSSDPDPGDTLTYAWKVDGQAAGAGATLTASFQTGGVHRVELTVTDPIGRQSTADRTIAVTAAADPPGGGGTQPPPPAGADTKAPVLSDLLARPARVRRGRPVAFRFGLDEAAAIRLEIRRARPGRRVGGACRKPAAGNRMRRRCTRYVRVTVVTAAATAGANTVRFSGRVRRRALPPGRYQARVTATDGAGNRSAVHTVAFRVRTP